MPNKRLIFIALATVATLATLSPVANADPLGDIMATNNEVGLALTDQNIDYHETDSLQTYGSPSLDSENGDINGYAITFSEDKDLWSTNNYLAFGYSHASGTTAYTGGVVVNGQKVPVNASSGDKTTDFYARVGTTFIPGTETMVTPYLEYGLHVWDRNVGESTAYGYPEQYQHSYAGAGVLLQAAPADALVVTADLFLGSMLNASIAAPRLGTQSMGDPTMLTRLGLSADYRIWHDVHLTFGWSLLQYAYSGSSANASGYLEPPSNTTLQVTSVGLAYGF